MTLKDYYIEKLAFNISPLARHALIGGGLGAAGGAVVDKGHRGRGALIGAGIGAATGAGVHHFRRGMGAAKAHTASEAVNKGMKDMENYRSYMRSKDSLARRMAEPRMESASEILSKME